MRPSECQDMSDLRSEIDRLDRQLVTLLVERAAYIDRAAAIKEEAGLAARLPDRVAQVLDNVTELAEQGGLDPAIIRRIWTELIEWSIAREEKHLGR